MFPLQIKRRNKKLIQVAFEGREIVNDVARFGRFKPGGNLYLVAVSVKNLPGSLQQWRSQANLAAAGEGIWYL
jgi:hypothetical protein